MTLESIKSQFANHRPESARPLYARLNRAEYVADSLVHVGQGRPHHRVLAVGRRYVHLLCEGNRVRFNPDQIDTVGY